jgi:hypothetical protein
MIRSFFVRQFVDFMCLPVQEREIVNCAFLRLVIQRDSLAVGRPTRRLFADVGRVGEVDDLASVARYSENINYKIEKEK